MDAYLETALAKLVEYINETPVAIIKEDLINAGHGYYPITTENDCEIFATNSLPITTTYTISTTWGTGTHATSMANIRPTSYNIENSTTLFTSYPMEFDYKAAA